MTRDLPTSFEANRVFVHPVTTAGDRLRLLTDSGGAMVFSPRTAQRLGMRVDAVSVEGQDFSTIELPTFTADAWIPDIDRSTDGRFPELAGKLIVSDLPFGDVDGILGQNWFGGRTWTIDYGAGVFQLREGTPTPDPGEAVPLGFARGVHFPSIEATVGGETLPFLLDTGATLHLSPEAHGLITDGDGPVRGTCFVVASIFDRWRKEHPEWRVLERADLTVGREPAIEVPAVTVASHTVGPVWFTRRADENFHDWMSRWMDRRVDGALGGSLLRYFRLTIDYPGATAAFERL